MSIEGRNTLLTGALGSLGRAQARELGGAGANLYLIDRFEEQGGSFAAELNEQAGFGEITYLQRDLSDLERTKSEIAELAATVGGFDILINNAALIINRPFQEFSLAEYEDQVRVNSSAAFALAQAVAPGMIQKGYGKIINFCSLTLNGRWDGYVPYVASKGALLGLTKTLARELGAAGVRVNAVSPGAIQSEAEERVFGDRLQAYSDWIIENQSLKVRGQPEDVAKFVHFLVSPDSDFISGQNFQIDGGW